MVNGLLSARRLGCLQSPDRCGDCGCVGHDRSSVFAMGALRPSGERAEATSALARAYLHSDLSPDDLAAAEGAMIMLLDDPSPLVRRAMAEVFASSQKAPPRYRRMRSPPISPRWRCRCSSARHCWRRTIWSIWSPPDAAACANRDRRPRPAAALGGRRDRRSRRGDACLALLENPDADIAPLSLDRIVERFGHLAAIRENLLARDDLPMPTPPSAARRSSRKRSPASSPRGTGSGRNTPNTPRAKLARRRPSRLRPRRHTRNSADLDPSFARKRATHRRHASACAVVGQCRAVRRGARRTVRPAARQRRRSISTTKRFRGFGRFTAKPCCPRSPIRPSATRLRRLRERLCARRAGRRSAAQTAGWSSGSWLVCSEAGMRRRRLLALLRRFAVEAAREEARLFCDELVVGFTRPSPPCVVEEARLVA